MPPPPRPAPPPPPNVRRAQPVQVDEDEQPTNIGTFASVAKSGAQPIGAAAVDEEAQHWREVYEQFLAKKRECGESIENLTFEKFKGTLQRNKDALVARHHCTRVKFTVYVKEGKAALKASPVK